MDDWSYALGFMVSDIRFHISVTRAGSNDIGFRLRKYAWWKTLFKHDRQDLLELIEDELDKFGIPLLETYYEEEDILKLFLWNKLTYILLEIFMQLPQLIIYCQH